MIRGELCESCGQFTAGYANIARCPICDKDVCNFCGNLQVCPTCFSHYDSDSGAIEIDGIVWVQIIEQGEEIGDWTKNSEV